MEQLRNKKVSIPIRGKCTLDSKDLSTVIAISVAGLVYVIITNPFSTFVSGIPFFRYIFSIGNVILISLALLLYSGKRWRFFLQGILISLLTLPIYGGTPNFNMIVGALIIIINSLHGDLLFNTYYSVFKQKNKLKQWAILTTTQFYLAAILLNLLNYYLFFYSIDITTFLSPLLIVVPIIVIECYIGGNIGFKIFQRINTQRPEKT